MTVDSGLECITSPATTERGLVRENQHLRKLVEQARVVAERYAVMLREGDHRIKNSLQVVASLVRLQAAHEATANARDALHSAATRIQAIGRIHDALQRGFGEDVVDVGSAIRKMCDSLQVMAGDPLAVDVHVDAHTIMAPVALAQPILLTVNELVVNALRHAFPDAQRGEVHVTIGVSDGRLWIGVADNGIGMPASAIAGGGYGMRLVRMMTEQMKGTLLIDTGEGTRVTIAVPEPATVQSVAAVPLLVVIADVPVHKSWFRRSVGRTVGSANGNRGA